ncbi:MAG: hypothetical protein K6F69_07310, partial [Treponema sp.]|nr:hypothetical protein [Treponema sp.]
GYVDIENLDSYKKYSRIKTLKVLNEDTGDISILSFEDAVTLQRFHVKPGMNFTFTVENVYKGNLSDTIYYSSLLAESGSSIDDYYITDNTLKKTVENNIKVCLQMYKSEMFEGFEFFDKYRVGKDSKQVKDESIVIALDEICENFSGNKRKLNGYLEYDGYTAIIHIISKIPFEECVFYGKNDSFSILHDYTISNNFSIEGSSEGIKEEEVWLDCTEKIAQLLFIEKGIINIIYDYDNNEYYQFVLSEENIKKIKDFAIEIGVKY